MPDVPTVGWFASPPEFRTPSMDRYTESVAAAVTAGTGANLRGEIFRPRPSRSVRMARGIPGVERMAAYWQRYARYLWSARGTSYDVNHVMDQAYSHLAYVLDGQRTLVSCHDIFPYKHWRNEIPGLPPRKRPPITVIASLCALRQARFVITSTEATAADLRWHFGITADRLRVIPYGVSPMFRPYTENEQSQAHRQQLTAGTNVKHVLVVSTGAPYKNHRGVIEAFSRLVRQRGRELRLLWVGSQPTQDVLEHARRAGVADLVIPLGRVDAEALPAIYRQADLLLFPSFYEGFGWPPLEAMASGIPVVTSQARAVVEVVGDAALRADADDHAALAAHMAALLDNDSLRKRQVARGLKRAAEFTWSRATDQIMTLYAQILKEAGE